MKKDKLVLENVQKFGCHIWLPDPGTVATRSFGPCQSQSFKCRKQNPTLSTAHEIIYNLCSFDNDTFTLSIILYFTLLSCTLQSYAEPSFSQTNSSFFRMYHILYEKAYYSMLGTCILIFRQKYYRNYIYTPVNTSLEIDK